MWASMPRFSFCWYFVICAEEAPAKASPAAAHAIKLNRSVRIVSSLEVEVKAQHQAVISKIRSVGGEALSTDPRILVVPGKSCPAVHKRIVAVAEDVVVEVAQVRCKCRIGLLRHPYPFRTLEEDQLRILHPVGFDKGTVPTR